MSNELEFYDFSLKGLFGRRKNGKEVSTDMSLPGSFQANEFNPVDLRSPFNDLDFPLFQLSEDPLDTWTLSDAVRGTQIFGGIGSGKTSGSGRVLALTFLKYGFGGIVLCGKPDERENWEKYAEATGRSDDLIIFDKCSGYEFNPLIYELTRQGDGAGETSNLVNLFMNIYQLGQRANGSEVKETQRFWENALRRLLARTIDLLKLAGAELTVSNMIDLVSSAPAGDDYMRHVIDLSRDESITGNNTLVESFFRSTFCTSLIWQASDKILDGETDKDETLFSIQRYFLKDFSLLASETRSGVIESFYGITEPFQSGILKHQFSKGINIYPEETFQSESGQGKIIILDYPVKNYLESGIFAQGIFKMLWQQAVERRKIMPGDGAIPVFLWADESQFFITEYDMMFQTTARSSRACTVFLTQNISNYYAMIGGNHPRAKVDSLLGNLCTKIFHANNDFETNQWAANTIGKDFRRMDNMNLGLSLSKGGGPTISGGASDQLHYQVEPREFTTLRSGGASNNYIVDAYIITAGKKWSNPKGEPLNYKKIEIYQR